MAELGRLITAMITPFDERGEVDYDEAGRLAKALVASGSDGLVVTGTTGETPTLSHDEKLGLYEATKRAVGDSAAIIAGTTTYNTADSVAISKEAEALGVDGILMTVPSYNKPPQEGLYQHFKTIADSVGLPCVLYNVPSRTSINMTAETTVRLSDIDNIVGTKEASSDLVQITKIIRDTDGEFKVWSGNDDETFPIMCAGGYGIVSVAAHIVGSQIKAMMGMILEGGHRERGGRASAAVRCVQDTLHRVQPHTREVLRGQGGFRRWSAASCRLCRPTRTRRRR